MVFNSNIFIFIFLPIVILLYKILDQKYRNAFLLLASIFFYGWNGLYHLKFVLLIFVLNYLVSYFFYIFRKKYILVLSIIFNVGLLVYFKYGNYILDNLNQYLSLNISLIELIVPMGISFIIFHAISYQVDIYRNPSLYTKNMIDVGLYFLFFPKLLQGPIIQFKDFYYQLKNQKKDLDFFISGIEKFIIGLSKKAIISDVLLLSVNKVLRYNNYNAIDIMTHWFIMVAYFFVIYFDWSGYSDMAIGISRMLGFDFKDNFNFPYVATSITEFWRRWHISLGNWFKEYVYIPLGGNRKGNVYIHLIIIFILTGVWHGAGILYLLWGLLHGIFMLFERVLIRKGIFDKIPKFIRWIYTTIVVSFGWLIFLMPHANQLIPFLKGMVGLESSSYVPFTIEYILSYKIVFTLAVAIVGSYVFAIPKIQDKVLLLNKTSIIFNGFKYVCLSIMFLYSLISIISGTYSPFIYFQF